MSRRRRPLLRLALAVVAAGGLAWAAVLAAVVFAARRDAAESLERPAAAIIVLGAAQYDGRPSPVLRARLDHGIALWRAGRAPRLIVTGGRRAGDRTSEAATGRRYAIRAGVPDSAIFLESEGTTTDESLRAAAALLHEIGRLDSVHRAEAGRDAGGDGVADGVADAGAAPNGGASHAAPAARGRATRGDDGAHATTAILVSDPFHMLRLGVLARRHGIVPVTSPTRTSPISARPRVALQYMLLESVKVPFVYLLELRDD